MIAIETRSGDRLRRLADQRPQSDHASRQTAGAQLMTGDLALLPVTTMITTHIDPARLRATSLSASTNLLASDLSTLTLLYPPHNRGITADRARTVVEEIVVKVDDGGNRRPLLPRAL